MDDKAPFRFFSWNPIASFGGDLEFHATEEEARASAESALENALDGEFDSDAEGICWGEVRGFAEFERVHEHGRGTLCWDEAYDEGDHECSAGVPLEWDYALSGKIVEVDTEQKKLEARILELEQELAALRARVCLTHKLMLEEGERCWKCRNSEILSALNALRASGTIARYDYLEVEGRKVWVWKLEESIEPIFSEVMVKLNFEYRGGYPRKFGADQFFISEWVEIEERTFT